VTAQSAKDADRVVVCGAGAAGIATALSAARAGAQVCLVEARPEVGGTVTHALIHTLAGLYDSKGELINNGLAQALVEELKRANPATKQRRLGRTWVLNVSPEVYQGVVERWLEQEHRIQVLCNTQVRAIGMSANRIEEIEAGTPQGVVRLRARAVVDATGSGIVVRMANPELLQNDPKRAAGGLIFSMCGVEPGALSFPRGLGILRAVREAAADGRLPSECGKAWVDSGVHENEAYVKLFVPLPSDWEEREARGEITREALKAQAAVVAFLQSRQDFAHARVCKTGCIGVRDGGRVRGEYCLSAKDVRKGRKFKDAACRCCWPIEYWDLDEGVSLEYLPDGSWYEIPLRALKVRGLENVWAAGKCLSADPLAQASARVVGTCWAMGEAVGKEAANHGLYG
jgi:hypothetical protein